MQFVLIAGGLRGTELLEALGRKCLRDRQSLWERAGNQASARRARTAAMMSSAEILRGVPPRPFSISAARSSRFSSGVSCSKAARSRGVGAAKEEMVCRLLVLIGNDYIETVGKSERNPARRGSKAGQHWRELIFGGAPAPPICALQRISPHPALLPIPTWPARQGELAREKDRMRSNSFSIIRYLSSI